jgi:pimeloyl-ACP methyl ester carboxylesterase
MSIVLPPRFFARALRQAPLVLLRGSIATVVMAIFFVVTQDFHLFPGLYTGSVINQMSVPPADVEALSTTALDGATVHVWRHTAKEAWIGEAPPTVALLFHGNAESLGSFVALQRWLAAAGVTSYSVEYRGYHGRFSGWPSEKGFYADADAAFELVSKREPLSSAKQLLVVGNSIGTGVAAYVAGKYQAGGIILLAPYAHLGELVAETALIGHLAPFLWYEFPTAQYVAQLRDACAIIAHGTADRIIGAHHSESILRSAHSSVRTTFLRKDAVGHNDLLGNVHGEVIATLRSCWTAK